MSTATRGQRPSQFNGNPCLYLLPDARVTSYLNIVSKIQRNLYCARSRLLVYRS